MTCGLVHASPEWQAVKLTFFAPWVYSHNVKGKCVKFPEKREHFRMFGCGLKLQGITKKFHHYISGKNFLSTARNLKVNEQSKYKSVLIFILFQAIKVKLEILNY